MKVLHVIPSLASSDGGPAHAVVLMQRALQLQGITIEIATTDDDGPRRRLAKVPAAAYQHCFAKWTEFYKVAPGFVPWMFRHVRDYDVIHIHALFSFVSVIAALIAAMAGVPYVVRPLGTLNRYGVEKHRPLLKKLSLRCIEGPLLRRAAAVHFTADAEEAEASQLGVPLRGIVLPLGIDDFSPPATAVLTNAFPALAGQRFILFMSRLDPKKNLEAVLQAFAITQRTLPAVRLVVAGNGNPDYVAGLQALAVSLGVQHRVVWTGFVAGEQKAALLAAAELFLLPSWSENFGIAAAEALMAGLPCILGHGVALSEAVVDAEAGIGVDTDTDSIAAALALLLESPALRERMQQNARKLARERYSLTAMGKGLLALYQRVKPA